MPSIRQLFDAHFDFIWRSVRRLGLTPTEADDATQSIFIIASRKLGNIHAQKERAFLFGIATRVAADVRKGAARRLEHELEDHTLDAATTQSDVLLDEARARRCLEVAILEMPMDLRTAFILFELEELTMAEIAAILEIPQGTVASRIRRARETFNTTMKRLQTRFGGGR
ncbi:MAG TPA: RNA polymerase sigma factor [Labilithrix sp.]|nr:RNA polymerase sigma factor [Labilithrix sp.]